MFWKRLWRVSFKSQRRFHILLLDYQEFQNSLKTIKNVSFWIFIQFVKYLNFGAKSEQNCTRTFNVGFWREHSNIFVNFSNVWIFLPILNIGICRSIFGVKIQIFLSIVYSSAVDVFGTGKREILTPLAQRKRLLSLWRGIEKKKYWMRSHFVYEERIIYNLSQEPEMHDFSAYYFEEELREHDCQMSKG